MLPGLLYDPGPHPDQYYILVSETNYPPVSVYSSLCVPASRSPARF